MGILQIIQHPSAKALVRGFVQQPRLLAQWVNDLSPLVGCKIISHASNILDAKVRGMGVRLQILSDEVVAAQIPAKTNWLRDEASAGSSLLRVSEWLLSLYWEQHLLGEGDKLNLEDIKIQIQPTENEDLELHFQLSAQERLILLEELQVKQKSPSTFLLRVNKTNGETVGRIEIKASLIKKAVLLIAGHSTKKDQTK